MLILARMAGIALVLATAMSVAATGRVTFSLLASGFICWSVVPALQLLTGLWMVRGAPVTRTAALEGYFATHRPWSLWILAMGGVLFFLPDPGRAVLYAAATAIVPTALTFRELTRFSLTVLGDPPRAARRRAAVHEGITIALGLIFIELSVALWPRVIEVLQR
jgi:hypothetical protein